MAEVASSGRPLQAAEPRSLEQTPVATGQVEARSEPQTASFERVTRTNAPVDNDPHATIRDNAQASQVLARVGDHAITAAQVAAETQTLELQQELGSLVDAYAERLGLVRTPGEDLERFLGRLGSRLGDTERDALAHTWEQRVDVARDQATIRLIDRAVLERMLGHPDAQGDVGAPTAETVKRLRARAEERLVRSGASKTTAGAVLDEQLDNALDEALWAPHGDALQAATADLDEASRASLRLFLTNVYGKAYGLRGPRIAARELRNRGDAHQLLGLARALGGFQWTVASMTRAAAMNPELSKLTSRLFAAAGIKDPGMEGATHLDVSVSTRGLGAKAAGTSSAAPDAARLVELVHHGDVHVVWVRDKSQQKLVLAGSTDNVDASAAAAGQALLEQLRPVIEARAEALPRLLRGEIVPGNAAESLLSDEALLALARESPVGTQALKLAMFDEALAGTTPAELLRRLDTVDATGTQRTELLDLYGRLRLLMDAQALPNALRSGGTGVVLPLEADARLDTAQSTCLATLQTFAIHAGLLEAHDVEIGRLGAASLAFLKRIAPPGTQSKNLTLDPLIARQSLVAIASVGRFESTPVGELILAHPAVWSDRHSGERTDQVQLVRAYLIEQGLVDESVEPGTSRFLAALEQSRHIPIDTDLCNRARERARRMPALGGPQLELLVSSLAVRTAGSPPAYDVMPATDASRESLRRRLAGQGSVSERRIERSELSQLAVHEPVVALKLARAQFLRRPSPVDASGYVDGVLTADELTDLHQLAFPNDSGVHARYWQGVIQTVRDGDVAITDLTRPLPASIIGGQTVLAELRAMASTVRSVTAPAIPGNESRRPLTRPVGVGLAQLRSPDQRPELGATAVVVQAADIERLRDYGSQRNDALGKEIIASNDVLERVGIALRNGGVRIVEDRIDKAATRDLQADARRLVTLLGAVGEATFADEFGDRDRVAGKLLRTLDRAVATAQRPVVFSDPVVPNDVRDWQVIAVRSEMLRAGFGRDVSLSRTATEQERAGLTRIDANFIDFMLQNHADAFGRSILETVLQGFPNELPGPTEARELLADMAMRMRAGVVEPWPSLNVTLTDLDVRTRAAKLALQVALRASFSNHASLNVIVRREGAVAGDLVNRLSGTNETELAPTINALLVQRGAIRLSSLPDGIDDTAIDSARMTALVGIARDMATRLDNAAAKDARELRRAAEIIEAAEKRDGVRLDGRLDGAMRAALECIARATRLVGSSGGMDAIDFAALSGGAAELVVRAPVTNAAVANNSTDLVEAFLGAQAPAGASAELERAWASWTMRSSFDFARAAETVGASMVLVGQTTRTLLQYDLFVAPLNASTHAFSSWVTTDDPLARAEAVERLGTAWSNVATTVASLAGSVNPVAYMSDIKDDVQAGQLDIAAGKLPAYAPMIVGTTLTAVAAGRRIVGAATMQARHATERLGFVAPRTTTVLAIEPQTIASEVATPGREHSILRRGVGAAYTATTSVADAVLNPRTTVVTAARSSIAGMYRAFGATPPQRFIRVADAASPPELSPAHAEWIARNPDGRLNVLVRDGAHERVLTLRNSDLTSLRSSTGALPRDLVARLGLRGDSVQRVGPIINALARQCPEAVGEVPAPVRTSVFSLAQAPDETRRWTVRSGERVADFELRNSTTLRLLRDSTSEQAFTRTLKALGLTERAAEVRAVVASFDGNSALETKVANRLAVGLDTGARVRLSGRRMAPRKLTRPTTATPTPEIARTSAPAAGTVVAPVPAVAPATPASGVAMPPATAHAGTPVAAPGAAAHAAGASSLPAAAAPPTAAVPLPAVLPPLSVEQRLASVTQTLEEWSHREAKAPLSAIESAERQSWMEQTRRDLASVDVSKLQSSVRNRLIGLRSELACRSIVADLRAAGLPGVTGRIVRSARRSLAGETRSAGFYFILAFGGQQLAVDLGTTLNDESLSQMERSRRSAMAVVRFAGFTAGTAVLAAGARRALPRLFSYATAIGKASIVAIPGLVEDARVAIAGYANPLRAMQYWQDLGIPEAGFMKIDPQRYEYLGWGPLYDSRNDLETLDKDNSSAMTPRATYWYENGNSALHERLRQLYPTNADVSPVRRIRLPQPETVTRYHEPVYDSVRFLDALPQLRTRREYAALANLDDVRQFDASAWRTDVRRAAREVLELVSLDNGRDVYTVNDEALRRLLIRQDRYSQLTETQRDVLKTRNDMTVRQAQRWATMVSLMRISPSDKEAALTQMIENYAAMYLANSMIYRAAAMPSFLNDSLSRGMLDRDSSIDDFYVLAPWMLRAQDTH